MVLARCHGFLFCYSQEADLVEVADVDGDGDVGRVAVVEEVREPDLEGDRGDDFAEAG